MSSKEGRTRSDATHGRSLRRPRFSGRWAVLRWMAAALVLAACAPDAHLDATVSGTPETSGDARGLPTAMLPDATRITLDVAATPEELARGLMYRPFLPDDRGMLLLFPEERVPSIWMKNTLVRLDLVFLDSSGRVVEVIERVDPCAADPCPHYVPRHPARTVLEIAAGVAGRHGLQPGDVIEFRGVEGYPVRPAPADAEGG